MKFRHLVIGGALLSGAAAVVGYWAKFKGEPEGLLAWPDPVKDPEARALLRRECRAAAREGRPLLVEFSAPWCEHCQAVKQTLREPDVSRLLGRFRTVAVNIGDDDELNDLRRELEARAIPAWVVVEPERCDAAPKEWKRLANTYPRGEARRLREFLQPLGG